jgi:predicted RNA binding protein YcfA (HicA-like mRNA interferase family)
VPSSIPAIPGVKVVKALKSAGFTVTRIKGSHHFMRHSDGRAVSVPVHSSGDVPKGTMRDILASVGMTPDEFRKLL